MVGAPSKNVYTVKAGSKGECTIQFDYKRGWEEAEPANIKQITFIRNKKNPLNEWIFLVYYLTN